jgi:hypothetical protein
LSITKVLPLLDARDTGSSRSARSRINGRINANCAISSAFCARLVALPARREKGRGRARNAYTSSTVHCVHAQAALPHAHSDNSSWGMFSHKAHLTEQESRPPARRHCMTQAHAVARVRTHPLNKLTAHQQPHLARNAARQAPAGSSTLAAADSREGCVWC